MEKISVRRAKRKHPSQDILETIVIDEESPQNSQDHESTRANCNQYKNVSLENNPIPRFSSIYKDNTLFAEFLLKCLILENSDGMLRIINKNLLKSYDLCDVKYKNSTEFSRVLTKALKRLDDDPEHKFSHVKDMVETLKIHKFKKRVELITLETNLKDKERNNNHTIKKQKMDNIVLDSDDELEENIAVVDLVDEQNDVVLIEEGNEEKENKSNENLSQNSDNGFTGNLLQPHMEVFCDLDNKNNKEDQIERVPQNEISRIEEIENEIERHRKIIKKYEAAEVTNDSAKSAYMLCERHKRKVVQLYRELCELVGEEPNKKYNVRLKVIEGHPPGPVRKLEEFINENIGEDGTPLFPDFYDVVKCVMFANVNDNLGWNKGQIMKEANGLFVQCGRALQQRRQRREYRDMLAKAPVPDVDSDPADHDPVLNATLERNRKMAAKKEKDLLERYCMLQDLPSDILRPGPSLANQESVNNNNKEPFNPKIDESDEDSNFEPPEVKMSISSQIADQMDTIPERSSENGLNGDCNMEITVKAEPMDVEHMLNQLGDDIANTATIVDILDPFVVIDISSDEDDSISDES